MTEELHYAAKQFQEILEENLIPEHLADAKIAEFISQYIQLKNVKRAAKACDLSAADGQYLFNCPDIHKAIVALNSKDVEKFGYDAAEVVERTKEVAFYDPVDMIDERGCMHEDLRLVPDALRRAIKKIVFKNYFEDDLNGVPVYKGKIITVEFHDKMKGLDMIAREKDVLKKTTVVQHDVSKNAREYLLGGLKRAEEAKLGLKDVTPLTHNTYDATTSNETLTIEHKPKFPKPPGAK